MEYTNRNIKGGAWDDLNSRTRGQRSEGDEDLLIFGYSCKLFRDDEKALYVDNAQHLIPWMGDPNLMIDRFDVRGALYDLSEAESKGKPFEETATEVELKEEEICNQERYLALFHDENLMHIYQEEEAKRLQSELQADDNSYYQVGFNYTAPLPEDNPKTTSLTNQLPEEVPTNPTINTNDSNSHLQRDPVKYSPTVDEDIFHPPPELNIPSGMDVPTTLKQNKVIVKTAKFVVSQGGQMEIVIKTKQAGNPMFNFLAFDNSLNAYYKHLVHTIRNGRYKWDDEPINKSEQNDQYLHPNLSQSVKPDLTPGIVSSPSRPSPHCAYSKLITKIREKQIASALEDPEFYSPVAPSSPVAQVIDNVQKEVETPIQMQPSITINSQPIVGLVDYPSFNQTADGSSDMEESEPSINRKGSFRRTVSRLQTHDYSNIKWPPPDIQMVIDKMASYITKNGTNFEEVVRNREDSRFMFLKKDHEYHPYYQCKMQLYDEVYGDVFKNLPKGGKTPEWKKKLSNNSSKKDIQNEKGRTISFSIKSREQEVSVTSHTTFPIESSTSEEDEEMEEEERELRRQEREKRRQERKLKADREKKEREEFHRKERLKREEERRKERIEDSSSGNEDLYDIFKYAQEMEREKTTTRVPTPDNAMPPSKQEERKKKAAVFLSKLKGTKDEKKTKTRPVYGPQLPSEFSSALSRSATQSPTTSRTSSELGDEPPPLPIDFNQPPPPPPRSPSPTELLESITSSLLQNEKDRPKSKSLSRDRSSLSRDTSLSPTILKSNLVDSSNTMTAILLAGINDMAGAKHTHSQHSGSIEKSSHKSRSHKKQTRQRSASRSSSTRRDRKKRKRSHYRRKKHRSRSRSRSRARSKSRRSSHKKKQKHSSHREKDKSSRKKKHRRHKSPSSDSSLPSSETSSPSTPSSLPSESDIDDCQVIESDETKVTSRGSSVVSLPPVAPIESIDSKSNGLKVSASVPNIGEVSLSGGEDSSSHLPPVKSTLFRIQADENTNSTDMPFEIEKKHMFDPNTSSAMAKITQGLRAKLNALLEKGNQMD